MSAVAEFVRLPACKVGQLRSAYDATMALGESVAEYNYSGYVITTLLPYLDERGIQLGHSSYDVLVPELYREHGSSLLFLTPAHRDAYLPRLSSEEFSEAELQAFYNDFNACAEGPEVGEAMLAGVAALRQSLASLDADSVIVCTIG